MLILFMEAESNYKHFVTFPKHDDRVLTVEYFHHPMIMDGFKVDLQT